jgi:hypothetical protein
MFLEQLLEKYLRVIQWQIWIDPEICRLDTFQACIFISEIFIALEGVDTD